MALGQDAVRRLTIIATEQGLTQVNQKLRENERISNAVSAAQTRMASATAAADQRLQSLLRQRDRYAATFNRAGVTGLIGAGSYDLGRLTSSAAFGLGGVAAQGAIGAARIGAPAVGGAAVGLGAGLGGMLAGLGPALAVAGTAYATFLALNAVIDRGTQLLEKYASAHRSVDRSDLTSNLENITKLQGDKISAAQVKYATDLGTRLEDANWQIEKFFKTSLDITDPALKLQSVWVGIVEAIAKATGYADTLLDKLGKLPPLPGPGLINLIPGGAAGYAAYRALSTPAPAAPTAEESLTAARGKLASAMEVNSISREGALKDVSTFSGRFGAAVYDINEMTESLKKNTKETKEQTEARNAWDRALDSVSRNIALQEAELKAVGLGTAALARYRVEAQLTEAAERAGVEITGERAKKYEELADRAEKAARALGEARLRNDLQFERDQIGRTDSDQSIASRLRGVYGDSYTAHMEGAFASQIRLNDALRQGRELVTDFASGFTRDLMNGVRAVDALVNSLKRVAERLIDIAIQKSAAGIFGSLTSSIGGGGSLPGGLLWQDAPNQFAAAFPTPGVTNFALGGVMTSRGSLPLRYYDRGGVANSPQVAVYGEGRKPEAYVPLPDGRSIPVTMQGSAGGTQVEINIINQSGQQMQARESGRRQNGNKVAIDMVLEAVAGSIVSGQGPVNTAMEGTYGLDRTKGMSA